MSVCRDFGGASCQPDRLHFYAFASIGGAGPNAMLEILPVAVAGLLFGILTPSIYLNMNAVEHVLDMEP